MSVQPVIPVELGRLDYRVTRVPLDQLERMVHKDRLEPLGHRAHLEFLDLLAHLAHRDSPELWGSKVNLAIPVSPEALELLESLE